MMRFWDGEWNDDKCVIVGVKDMPESVNLGVGCIYPSLDGHSLISCFFFRQYFVCGDCLVFISNLTKTLSGWCTKWRCPFLSIISLHPNWTLQSFSFQILASPSVHCGYVLQLKCWRTLPGVLAGSNNKQTSCCSIDSLCERKTLLTGRSFNLTLRQKILDAL